MPVCALCKCDVEGLIPIPEVSQKTDMYLSLKGIKDNELLCLDCWCELVKGTDWSERLLFSIGEILQKLTLDLKSLEKDNEIQDKIIQDFGEKMTRLDSELEGMEKANDKVESSLKTMGKDLDSLELDEEDMEHMNDLLSDTMWELDRVSEHISDSKKRI